MMLLSDHNWLRGFLHRSDCEEIDHALPVWRCTSLQMCTCTT